MGNKIRIGDAQQRSGLELLAFISIRRANCNQTDALSALEAGFDRSVGRHRRIQPIDHGGLEVFQVIIIISRFFLLQPPFGIDRIKDQVIGGIGLTVRAVVDTPGNILDAVGGGRRRHC